MQSIRIIEIPKCKMVSSGTGMFGQKKFGSFFEWFANLPRTIYPKDFLFWDGVGLCWLYLYDEHLNVPSEFEIIDFEGGLYSVATDIDQHTDVPAMDKEVDEFLDKSGFVRDETRFKIMLILVILGLCVATAMTWKTHLNTGLEFFCPKTLLFRTDFRI